MTAISPELEQLLGLQQRVDALRERALRRGGRDFVDLGYANSHDGPSEETLAALRRALDASDALAFQYTPYGGATVPRRLVATALSQSHGERFRWKDVILTPGAMAALNIAFRSVRTRPGDEVIVITPCWLDYPTYLENLGLVARLVPVQRRSLRLDLDAIAAALTPRTVALVFSQPANPSGLIYSADELRMLGELLQRAANPPLLISDECHRDIVFGPDAFVPALGHYDKCCIVYSFGKSLLLQGQRCGYLAVSPRHPERERYARDAEQLTRVMGFCTPTSLMQLALADLLKVRAPLETTLRRQKRAHEALVRAGYEVVPAQATFFLYPRVPGGDALHFTERLAERGVMALPSTVFHHEGHFRLSLTTTDEMLERGLQALSELAT